MNNLIVEFNIFKAFKSNKVDKTLKRVDLINSYKKKFQAVELSSGKVIKPSFNFTHITDRGNVGVITFEVSEPHGTHLQIAFKMVYDKKDIGELFTLHLSTRNGFVVSDSGLSIIKEIIRKMFDTMTVLPSIEDSVNDIVEDAVSNGMDNSISHSWKNK